MKEGRITGRLLRDAVISGANRLAAERQTLNVINVFPVPDGDTGANMTVTMELAKKRLQSLPDSCLVGEVAEAAASATLRGSRGNSGAILALYFRGIARALRNKETAGAADLIRALKEGAETAYRSVRRPAEGTILTVARESAWALALYYTRHPGIDAAGLWSHLTYTARQILKTTPGLLEVLADEEVVDAGGLGLCLIFEGMEQVFAGKGCVQEPEAFADENAYVNRIWNLTGEYKEETLVTYRVFLRIKGKETKFRDRIRAALEEAGDSVVCTAGKDEFRFQVFTEKPVWVLERCMGLGTLAALSGTAGSTPGKVDFKWPDRDGQMPEDIQSEAGDWSDGGDFTDSDIWTGAPAAGTLYCTEFMLLKDAGTGEMAGTLSELLEEFGESAVTVESEDMVKCHVHTPQPAELLRALPGGGYLVEMKIENLDVQMAVR